MVPYLKWFPLHGEKDVGELAEALEEMEEFQETLGQLGLGDYVEVDLRIVRGLAYYTGIVFEIFDRDRQFRAVCGGDLSTSCRGSGKRPWAKYDSPMPQA